MSDTTDTSANQEQAQSTGEEPKTGEATDEFSKAAAAQAESAAVEDWKARAAYFAAEIENMRKRFAREKTDLIRFGNEALIRSILPVLDNLDLGLKAAKAGEQKLEASHREHPVYANLLKGLEMTLKHFEQTLDQLGVSPIKSVGQNFDPTLHEAVGESQDSSQAAGLVTQELQRGFQIAGRVIRTAKVFVNKV
jgi:molecular chaperone GrpE